jgi:hypothetical protein
MDILWPVLLLVLGILMVSVLAVNVVIYWIGWIVIVAAAVAVLSRIVRK